MSTNNNTVEVAYQGGPLDGDVEFAERKHFQSGRFPVSTIEHDGENHLYEAWELFNDDTTEVTVHHVGQARVNEGDSIEHDSQSSGYDGWLPTDQQYPEGE